MAWSPIRGNATWYADPSGASDISELRRAGLAVKKGNNAIRAGISAVTARINEGTLRVLRGGCPNLIAEAGLYRWEGNGEGSENPVDEHNHALAALRYLVATLDARRTVGSDTRLSEANGDKRSAPAIPWEDDERLWTPC